MAAFGFHCSHEQHSPKELLEYVKLAEECGFTHGMCSDHFHPWTEERGQSGYAWSWLGAAMEATNLSFGTVCAPGQRYHPAIVAQKIATLGEMYGERFWTALGSGEALNESITGEPWPSKEIRNQRLRDSLHIIRRLLNGETVTFEGSVRVKEAKLFTCPESAPLLIGAALTPETAAWMGPLFDGLITAGSDRKGLKDVLRAFRENGGEKKPAYLQTALSYASTKEKALQTALRSWRQAALELSQISSLSTPREFNLATADIEPEQLQRKLKISDDLSELLDSIRADADLGFDCVYLHYIGEDTPQFIRKTADRLFE